MLGPRTRRSPTSTYRASTRSGPRRRRRATSGTARGSFDDLSIIEAITSESPPPNWGLPPEDWWPGDEGDWYIGGSFPVELAMSGVAVMGCASLDDVITYGETPFSESATVTAWMTHPGSAWPENQGPDHETHAFLTIIRDDERVSRLEAVLRTSRSPGLTSPSGPVPDPLEVGAKGELSTARVSLSYPRASGGNGRRAGFRYL